MWSVVRQICDLRQKHRIPLSSVETSQAQELLSYNVVLFSAEHPPLSPVVDTVHGKVLGKYVSLEGVAQTVAIFLGVPFAKPPLGSLRFAPPQPAEPWDDVKNTTSYPPMCSQDAEQGKQMSELFSNRKEKIPLTFSEDCLYLNIYTPADLKKNSSLPVSMGTTGGDLCSQDAKGNQVISDLFTNRKEGIAIWYSEDCLYLDIYTPVYLRKKGSLPVMVWIHGGGLALGGASTYDGLALSAHENVIVVTIQYRLGIWGFFSTGDEHSPGNWGHLDQVAALLWVQDSIASFGGNPGSVTIFGESAGGESVSVLVLSPLTKNLFHRAISGSGVTTVAGMVMKDAKHLAEHPRHQGYSASQGPATPASLDSIVMARPTLGTSTGIQDPKAALGCRAASSTTSQTCRISVYFPQHPRCSPFPWMGQDTFPLCLQKLSLV
ncbi:Carboxylesterase 3 [Fukomys damarensis]|uniref:Carboxylic ester hydrolase n=1 Tax=Fukomys damarensis TaxID=885580 RepID=A0A091D8Z6_FUKDA|nr:Carboxylesterase 3 [Fukomys damarensis]